MDYTGSSLRQLNADSGLLHLVNLHSDMFRKAIITATGAANCDATTAALEEFLAGLSDLWDETVGAADTAIDEATAEIEGRADARHERTLMCPGAP